MPAAPSLAVRDGVDERLDVAASSAPTHIGQGSIVQKIVTSRSRSLPTLRAASRSATTTAWAVGSSVSRTRSWPRATIASSSDGDRGVGPLATGDGGPRLGQRLAHVQLVVHGPDHTRRVGARPVATIAAGCPIYHPGDGSTRRIGVLTGGGDVPGLNSVIKSVTYRATELGMEVIGIRRGWEGLTHVQPGRRARPRVRPAARPAQHPDDRPDRRDGPPHLAHEPGPDEARIAARRGSSTDARPSATGRTRTATT